MSLCIFKKSDTEQCRARALSNSAFCFFHAPTAQPHRRDAQQRGGRNNKRNFGPAHPPVSAFDFSNPRGVLLAIEHAVNALVQNPLDARSAHEIGYLSDCAIRALNLIVVTAALERLERLQLASRIEPANEQDEDTTFFEEVK
jgi:hypothetical protein